jgi:hypothetical protein
MSEISRELVEHAYEIPNWRQELGVQLIAMQLFYQTLKGRKEAGVVDLLVGRFG